MRYSALVDSGSERVFAAPGLARELRVDLETAPEVQLGLGGRPRRVRFATVTLHLFKDLLRNDDDPIHEWEADVGFLREWEPPWAVLLGRDGFFNQFTVTMHGAVPGMVVEPWGTFDDRFGTVVEQADTSAFHEGVRLRHTIQRRTRRRDRWDRATRFLACRYFHQVFARGLAPPGCGRS